MKRGAFAVIIKGDKILFVKPPDWVSQFSGHWNFPGGVVEIDESLEDGAKREAFEETSIVCEVEDLLMTDHNEKFDTSITIFKAKYISGEITIQTQEIKEATWMTIEEALNEPLAFEIKKVLLKLT
ncbi:MAG: NUDIX hydrolase [Patescibacteria group bacterium]|jgi:ADP-ribose pyrophosphatase YjhB (NUDIX family)|nr:NUDIX hydrolase [Patescibacteria group bacterium]